MATVRGDGNRQGRRQRSGETKPPACLRRTTCTVASGDRLADPLEGHNMGLKPGLVTAAAAGLIFGLSACGSSGSTASQPAMKSGSQMSSPAASSGAPSPAAWSSSPVAAPGSAVPAAAGPGLITIKDFRYVISGPVAPREKVKVRNEDTQSHTVTSGKGC